MDKKLFTDKEIKILIRNKYIKNVTAKEITYADEFKRLFIEEFVAGKLAKQIFEEHDFNISLIGMKRVHTSRARWLRAYNKDGILGLIDKRKNNSGRQREKELSLQEKYEKLEAQNNLLQAENELLKKLDARERGLKRK